MFKKLAVLLVFGALAIPMSFGSQAPFAHAATNNGIINDTTGVGMNGVPLGGNSFTNNGTINVTDKAAINVWNVFGQPPLQVGMGYYFDGQRLNHPPFNNYSFTNAQNANINVNYSLAQINNGKGRDLFGMYALFENAPVNDTVSASLFNDGFIHLDYDANYMAVNIPNSIESTVDIYGMNASTGANGQNGYFYLNNNGYIEAHNKFIASGNFTGVGRFILDAMFSGLHAYSNVYGSHNINNRGVIKFNNSIDISFTSAEAYRMSRTNVDAEFYGMFAESNYGSHKLYNYGDIEITSNITMRSPYLGLQALSSPGFGFNFPTIIGVYASTTSGGLHGNETSTGGHEVHNKGNIVIKNQVNTINGQPNAIKPQDIPSIYSYNYGLYVKGGKIGNNVSNSGLISVASINSIAHDIQYNFIDPRAIGMYVEGEGDDDYIGGESGHNISNSGIINAYTELNHQGQSSIDGISGQLQSYARAAGMYMQGIDNTSSKMQNSGIINASLKRSAINATGYAANPAQNYAAGMVASSTKFTTVEYLNALGRTVAVDENYGPIKMELINTGIMNVNSSHKAYGLLVTNEEATNPLETSFSRTYVTNTGHIHVRSEGVDGSRAYELYADDNTTVGTWATTLNGLGNYRIFGVNDNGSNLHFAQNTLILRPGKKSDGFKLGRVYNFDDYIEGDKKNVSGAIGAVAVENPLLKATLYGSDIDNQSFVLDHNITAESNVNSRLMAEAYEQILGRIGNIGDKIQDDILRRIKRKNFEQNIEGMVGMPAGSDMAQASTAEQDHGFEVFVSPYGAYNANNQYGTSGSNSGMSGGVTYNFNERFAIGAHMDLNFSNSDIDTFDTQGKTTSVAFGVHANYYIMPEWYLRAQLSAGFGQSENDMSITDWEGNKSSAENEYNSSFFSAGIYTGYVWALNAQHSITPEIGLSYLGLYSQGYDVNFKGYSENDIYDFGYGDTYHGALYGHLSVRYDGNFALGNSGAYLRPYAAVGLRQNLSNASLETDLNAFGDSYTSYANMDSTMFTAKAGLELAYENVAVSLNYDGSYGYHTTSHGGSLNLKFGF